MDGTSHLISSEGEPPFSSSSGTLNKEIIAGTPLLNSSQIHSPRLGDIVDSGTSSPAYVAWRAGMTILCRRQLYSLN
jgi:hypothetical protein